MFPNCIRDFKIFFRQPLNFDYNTVIPENQCLSLWPFSSFCDMIQEEEAVWLRKPISQEILKIIACASMLLDHIGVALCPWTGLRIIGRLAFPIYCFLLSEGLHHTKSIRRYGLRLFLCMLLSELPFDLFSFGRFSWAGQSVMVTLFLAFLMGCCTRRISNDLLRPLVILPFALAAELLACDYGGFGVVMAALFLLTRELPHRALPQAFLLAALSLLMGGLQPFALAAMLPIAAYSGEKSFRRPGLSRLFYLFYPAHLLILYFWGIFF